MIENIYDYLKKEVEVCIDRKLESRHPEWNFIYTFYGYLPNTLNSNREEFDCYVLGVFELIT